VQAARSRPANPRPACPAPLPLACPSRFLPLDFFCFGTGITQKWNGTSHNHTQAGTKKNRRAGAGGGGRWHKPQAQSQKFFCHRPASHRLKNCAKVFLSVKY